MMKQSTQVPNLVFDKLLPRLTESELKILLIIIRQTAGWIDRFTGSRKTRDRITQSQFVSKAGLSPRIVSKTLKMLSDKQLIEITDIDHKILDNSMDRKGKSMLYYSFTPVHFMTSTSAHFDTEPVHKVIYNKTKRKETNTKLRESPFKSKGVSVGEVIKSSNYLWRFGLDKS